ncbi:MAG TPA: DUF929 family protein [Trebonia sp.]|jgi:hypothetical protein|nr:DUF929 family protein [Trebonia sp.]
MGRASMAKQDGDRRTRIAAQRAAAQRAQRLTRLLIAGGAIVVVVVIVLAFVVFGGHASSGGKAPTAPTGSTLAQTISKVTTVPVSTSDAVGTGNVTSPPTSISGPPLTSGGKPEMLYLGAEYCPYCAAERWAMVVALSRFGTFTGLQTTHSAAADGAGNAEPFPNTATWTFAHSTYTSKYLTFTPVEMNTNIPDKATGSYTTLQTPTKAQQDLIDKYDAADQGAIPFVDFGNKYVSIGASYDPGVLSGLTWSQIATDLHDPNSAVAKSVLGAANYLTAAICGTTHNQPADVCTPTVKGIQAKI